MIAVNPGVTFKIEHLKTPWYLLPMNDTESVFKNLASPDFTQAKPDTGKIIARSSHVGRLVEYKEHPFFQGMYAAYADHRPFILSPDMIWLLISQGFARHVTHNAEELRSRFVDFSGQTTLIVRNDQVKLDDDAHRWEEIFPEFTKQIREHIKEPSLVDILTSDFSTTDPVSRIASEITIMESMKPYFEFVTMRIICGIPKVTLEGTTEDWERLLEKARYLRKYNLDWWLDEIEPLLEEFVRASKKKIDKRFWRNMFKFHTLKQYGSPTVIDGWIVKFFPYDKEGRRNDLKSISNVNRLPSELVKVDVKYIEVFQDTTIVTPLQFWAGFIGLQQDSENYSLRPEIGWLVKIKGEDSHRTKKMLEREKASLWSGGMSIRVSTVPEEILEMEEIRELSIDFTGKIQIPQEMKQIKIDRLNLSGEVSETEIKKIRELFPDTELIINRKKIP
ncbi:MAG: DUF4419 domain-containing protein [Bacteroidales bacterium]|nr:DUF4419 domain-containing protein [Bacteroidales bacterium]